jgi:DNA polymerase III subunit epsilon
MAKRIIYYDTETTGLKYGTDRIIEIAAYDPEKGKTFCELVNPEMTIPEISIKICNITDEMVKDKSTFHTVGQRFIDFCSDGVLLAHNNDAFDKNFLKAEFERCDLIMPEWEYIDSLKWARKYRYDLPKHSLQYLREVYNVEANQAHRALDDVMVLYNVFKQMTDDLSTEQILELMKPAENITKMPFGKYVGRPLKDIPKNYVSWLKESGFFKKNENKQLLKSFEELGVL